ncbi:MAG: hypothetical protein GY820_20520 [Gammaproteobacteria bacterium]|nr:hypothetical protein [Gammaproteobacteria bacterium]
MGRHIIHQGRGGKGEKRAENPYEFSLFGWDPMVSPRLSIQTRSGKHLAAQKGGTVMGTTLAQGMSIAY